MKNKIQLITYVDRIACSNFKELNGLLNKELAGLFGGVHVLPFFNPIDGEDAGFDPINHKMVDPRLGDWTDVKRLTKTADVMADLIVNHVSADSDEFKDFLKHGDASQHAPLFLTFESVFPNGASETDLLSIYRPRPGFPFTKYKMADGSQKLIWTTFTPKQIDIDVNSPSGIDYLDSILEIYQEAGITMIRLDAAGYAIKKAGSSCFMIPETFEFIDELTQKARNHGIEVLVEIHSFYKTQIEIAQKVDYVYDFALPVLVLDALFNKRADNLKYWLKIAPRNVITVLDTHDGIGIVDVASEGEEKGLIPDDVLEGIVDKIHENSEGRSRKATGAAASNLDLYQVNCTYFEALGSNEDTYLAARAIQFFVPGVPQVYYVGLFGDENDMELLARTNVGRDINRHYYSKEEIQLKTQTEMFQKLAELMKLRNTHEAFNGEFGLEDTEESHIKMKWKKNEDWIALDVDLKAGKFQVTGTDGKKTGVLFDS
ncbi:MULTISPECIES: sucrose phosphorylase [Flavobacteriaceae]|uniref:sucrose phosphorylase n=1 Tax=Flavobacteriaceae TaxID=49546 RepID=UPI001491B40A|nr:MULTISPECIES: sucrose phosphorylase [Allomuricauda]MDC6367266.1 sucrose phosphorylase [Muricauda sp. AC10]